MTIYEDVFKKFTLLVNSSSHLNLTNIEIEDIFKGYLSFGCFYFQECTKDLSDRDDLLGRFNITITDTEQWIISHAMVICWLKPLINYEENMALTIGDRDYTPTSAANHIHKLKQLYDGSIEELDRLIIGYGYSGDDLSELA